MPVSDEGDNAHEANACDRACWRVVCMFSSRDKFGGNGVACFSFAGLRFTVDGGVGSLQSKGILIRILLQIYPVDGMDKPSPDSLWCEHSPFFSTRGSTSPLAWRYTE